MHRWWQCLVACWMALAAALLVAPRPAGAAAIDAPTKRLIIKFRDDAAAPRRNLAPEERIRLLSSEANVALSAVRPMVLGAHVVALERAMPLSEARAIAGRLSAHPDVEYTEPDRRMYPHLVPNDPLLGQQPYLANTATAISAFGAWDITTGSANVVVAIVDTGYRPHEGMSGRFLPGYDFISDIATANDGDGRDPDASDPGDWVTAADIAGPFKGQGCTVENSSWHGTMVSSVIAANSNDGEWSAGIDWKAMILPVRVLGKCGGDFSDILDGVAWAAGLSVPGVPANPHPAQVINMSLGDPGVGPCTQGVQSVLNAALTHGVTRAIVVSAGNDDDQAANHMPANCAGVITVAATNDVGSKAGYSNFGAAVTIGAPGGDSRALHPTDLIETLSNSGTMAPAGDNAERMEGTSFSAPMVSGVVSLMLSVAPNLTAGQVRSILTSTAKPFPAGSTCAVTGCGAGILSAQDAVASARSLGGTPNYEGLWWASPAMSESGWGINLAHQGDVIFATWFTYDSTRKAWWLTMTANKVSDGVYSGTLYRTNGAPFYAFTPPAAYVAAGEATLTFTSPTSGTFSYQVNDGRNVASQVKAIVLQTFGPPPTCVWGAQADLTTATNYQDLWWAAPSGAESGWGVNIAQQGATIFATWFTYDANHNPLWLSVTAMQTFPATYQGTLYLASGPAFNAVPFDPVQVNRTAVGIATFTFGDGNDGTFAYNVDLGDGVNKSSQVKQITRQVLDAPGTVCR
jgi:serine protease